MMDMNEPAPPGGRAKSSRLFTYPILLLTLLFVSTLFHSAEAVKKEDFKTCDQSSFCKRNRHYAKQITQANTKSPYQVLKDSISFKNSKFQADIINSQENVKFTLEVGVLDNDAVRVRINEKSPIKPRYDNVKDHVLVAEPKSQSSDKVQSDKAAKDQYIIKYSDDFRYNVKITYNPLKIDFTDGDKPVLSFNERNLFNFEHYRKKEDKKEFVVQTDSDSQVPENKDDLGLWEETFKGHTDPKKDGPSSIGLDVSFHGFDHVYGIPQHASNLSLKSTDGKEGGYQEPYRLYNLDVFEYDLDNPMALYGSIPFMVAHKKGQSAGLFWMNSAEMWIDLEKTGSGSKKSSHTHWIAESGLVDLFVFLSPEPKKILKQYGDLTGFTALPPAFAIGYHQCRWNYIDQNDVAQVDAGFDEHDIPYDVLWLDIEHTDGKKYFTWDLSKFPDPKAMQNDLASRGRKMVTIVDPHIKRDDSYYIYKEGTDKGFFVKNAEGKDFDGWCWPGSSSWVDYTRKDACDWWISKFQLDQYQHSTEHLYVWNDMNEPSVFSGPEITMAKDLLHDGGVEHREVHNMFGMLFHRSTAYGLVKRLTPNRRPFVLSRAFFPGTQRFGAIWTGDNGATWDYLEYSTPMLLSIGLTGVSFSGADVGGFFGNPEPELLVRWYQTGAFQPFFRGHAHIDTKRREPWLFGEPYTTQIRQAIKNRYALLPYWYTLLFQSSIDGTPAMRPLLLEFPENEDTFAVDDQFMVGSGLLVKPIVKAGVTETEVFLPGTEVWYNYFNDKRYTPGKHTVPAPADTIPVFLRSGSIITQRNRQRRSASLMQKDPITLVIAVDSKGEASGKLYLDDGETYDYLRSGYAYRQFTFKNNRLVDNAVESGNYTVINPLPFEPSLPKIAPTPGLAEDLKLVRIEKVIFLGIKKSPKKVICEKCGREVEFSYDGKSEKLVVKDPKLGAADDWSLALQ